MQRSLTKHSDQFQTLEQGKERKTENNGRKNSYRKSSKGSNRKRRGNGRRGSAVRNQRNELRRTAFKVNDVLPQETIAKLSELKVRLK